MRKKEQRLWDVFKRYDRGGSWLQRVENVVGDGMPDVYVGRNGAWVELKAPTAPKKESTRLLGSEGLRASQINWHLKKASYGQRSFVLIKDSLDRIFLVPGVYAAKINGMTVDELTKISVATDWEGVIKEVGG